MGDINTNLDISFSQYPLIGSNIPNAIFTIQRRNDGINATEMLNYMFKKQFGIPNALPYINYAYDEPTIITAINNSTLDKQYSQNIPYLPPTDKIEDSNFNTNEIYNSESKRFISQKYPYMVYYENITMTQLSDIAFYVGYDDDNNDTVIRINLSQKAISQFYGRDANFDDGDLYYGQLKVYGKISNTTNYSELSFGIKESGNWLLDCDTGILTFYDNIGKTNIIVNGNNPPRISFWRYEGLIGNNTVMSVADF